MKHFALLVLIMAIATTTIAGPSASVVWGTVSRTEAVTNLTDVMLASTDHTAPGLAVAMAHQALKASEHIAGLYAVDTSAMSPEDLQAYVEALTSFNQALRGAHAAALSLGNYELAASLGANVNALIDYAIYQGNLDPLFDQVVVNGPSANVLWGTVSVVCTNCLPQ